MSDVKFTVSDRGFKQYALIEGKNGGDPRRANSVRLYESSSATEPMIWLKAKDCDEGSGVGIVHLSLESAQELRDQLEHVIRNHYQLEVEDEEAVPVQPLEDRVLIKLDPQPTVSAGGIALPNTQEKDQTTGEVIAVGPGRRNDRGELVPMTVKVGQHVMFSKYAGLRVEQAGKDVIVVHQNELLAVITA